MSADGSEVAFVTTAVSNLVLRLEEEERAVNPAARGLQVAVRHLDSDAPNSSATTYRGGSQTEEPVRGGSGSRVRGQPERAAAIPEQLRRRLDQRRRLDRRVDGGGHRRTGSVPAPRRLRRRLHRAAVAAGGRPGAPTRRVTGGSDPLAPACVASAEQVLPEPPNLADPCQGPFETAGGLFGALPGLWTGSTEWDYVPQLSSDGDTVAFLATARFIASGEELRSAETLTTSTSRTCRTG